MKGFGVSEGDAEEGWAEGRCVEDKVGGWRRVPKRWKHNTTGEGWMVGSNGGRRRAGSACRLQPEVYVGNKRFSEYTRFFAPIPVFNASVLHWCMHMQYIRLVFSFLHADGCVPVLDCCCFWILILFISLFFFFLMKGMFYPEMLTTRLLRNQGLQWRLF